MTATQRWRCGDCGDVHDFECDAQECCPVSIFEQWECDECNEIHSSESSALDCCGEDRPPTKAELEAAGQIRLPL